MNTYRPVFFKLASTIFLLLFLNACESKPDSQPVSAKQIVVEADSSVASAHAKHAHGKSGEELQQHQHLVKPGAAVSLKTPQPLTVSGAGVHEFQLQLISPLHTGKMTVNVAPGEGFEIVSSQRQFDYELQEGGDYQVPLVINASAEGRFYIQLHVSITTDGQSSSRVVAAILQVGEPAVKAQKAAAKSTREDDEAIISLPAQETISPR